jgi:CysZ protein
MIGQSLALALGQMGDPAFRRVLWKGVGLAVLLLALSGAALLWLLARTLPETVSLPWLGEVGWIASMGVWAAIPVILLLSAVLMVPVAAAMASLFLDEVAAAVEARHYPRLRPARPQPWAESLRDAARSFGVVVLANLLALVAYLLLAPLAPLIWVLLNGWLLGRESFRTAALRREVPMEVDALTRRHRGAIWTLGALTALPLAVPVLNVFAPVLSAAAFTHLYHRLAGSA